MYGCFCSASSAGYSQDLLTVYVRVFLPCIKCWLLTRPTYCVCLGVLAVHQVLVTYKTYLLCMSGCSCRASSAGYLQDLLTVYVWVFLPCIKCWLLTRPTYCVCLGVLAMHQVLVTHKTYLLYMSGCSCRASSAGYSQDLLTVYVWVFLPCIKCWLLTRPTYCVCLGVLAVHQVLVTHKTYLLCMSECSCHASSAGYSQDLLTVYVWVFLPCIKCWLLTRPTYCVCLGVLAVHQVLVTHKTLLCMSGCSCRASSAGYLQDLLTVYVWVFLPCIKCWLLTRPTYCVCLGVLAVHQVLVTHMTYLLCMSGCSCSGPISAHILARDDAIQFWRQLMGPTKVFQ